MPLEDPEDLTAELLAAHEEVRVAARQLMDAIARRDDLSRRLDDISR